MSTSRTPSHWVVTDDGARLAAYVDGPSDAPVTVVLAHGWTLSHHAWTAVAEQVADRGARVVRFDQRDHARSTGGSSRPGIKRLGDDLAEVVAALAPEGRLVLGGHSMGGMTVMAMAGRHPHIVAERTERVVLTSTAAGDLSTPALPGGPALPWVMRGLARLPQGVRLPGSITSPRTRHLLYGADAPDELVAEGRALVTATSARALGGWFGALHVHDEVAALPRLRDTDVRVLVGEKDRLTPPHHSYRLAEHLPDAHLEVVPRAGHMLPMERPDLLTDHLIGGLVP